MYGVERLSRTVRSKKLLLILRAVRRHSILRTGSAQFALLESAEFWAI